MEMASFCLKIRHVFADTSLTERSIGAGPPVIIQLSGWNIVKSNAGMLIGDVRRDIAINFMLTWHKLSLLIGQFEFEV